MSKYKLTFKLKQHTPIIHFQHNQHGATLRASELKPKLDKFLIEKADLTHIINAKEVPRQEYKKWFINQGREHLALDYKVKVNTNSAEIETKEIGASNRYSNYFADMGRDYADNPNGSSMAKGIIEVDIICFISVLKDKIKTLFSDFLFHTNFGTRQNKGFGSFYTEDCIISVSNVPYLVIPKNKSIKMVFKVINYYYLRLKSGINYNGHYKDSFLKIYLLNKNTINYSWEKRWLKEQFIGLEPNEIEERYARALLGVVDNYTFRPKLRNRRTGEVYPETEITISVSSDEVERFKSPIIFKPILTNNEWRIYIITSRIPIELLGKDFVFKEGNKEEIIKTPTNLEVIDIDDLINEYNKDLTSEFEARSFTKFECKVKIMENKQKS